VKAVPARTIFKEKMKTWKIAGINFDHMHMGDLLRNAFEHPHAEIVGICDKDVGRMEDCIRNFSIPEDRVYTDVKACMESAKPDIVILCPATGEHADYVEAVAPYGVHVLVEKPFAGSLEEADRMIEAMRGTGKEMIINWPLRWYAPYLTMKRLIAEGHIGEMKQVHHYGGNRGPLRHGADKIEKEPSTKSESWFYQKNKAGGSMNDYLGYGVTMGTWFFDGKKPIEVTAAIDQPDGLEVDEHSVTVARYATGLSKFETRWGTFTDPWILQPQPKCGFIVVGSKGTISAYDYDQHVRLQTEECPEGEDLPVDEVKAPGDNPIRYFIHCLENSITPDGPLSPEISRIGQQIVDTAMKSALEKRTLPLKQ